ncbi:MAG: alpha-amylase, partial [Bacteroidales bacterium]|nr:alpha-amylase [Bacteroidales bacterium]
PTDLSGWKQAVTFLLTMPGTPQIYYGTELLMHGNKSRHDGYVRLDVPGGWPGDEMDQFTREGRDAIQNEAFDYLSKLLHWRQGNEVIAHGGMKHYVLQKGVYLYERFLGDDKVLVFMNGTTNEVTINLDRYTESIKGLNSLKDFLSGKTVTLGETLTLSSKEVLLLE